MKTLATSIQHKKLSGEGTWLARWTTVLMVQSSDPLVGECLFPSVISEQNLLHNVMMGQVVLLSEFRRHKWAFSVS